MAVPATRVSDHEHLVVGVSRRAYGDSGDIDPFRFQAGLNHRPEFSAVITFTIFEAAYYSEIMRAGIQSVPRGQVHAGYAVGMTYAQCMKLVVLPQAFRNMLPVLLTQTIVLFQDTSLVYAIGAYDWLKGFQTVGQIYNRPNEILLVAGLCYFAVSFGLSMLVRRLQNRSRSFANEVEP